MIINIRKLTITTIFFIAFVLPIYELRNIGLPVDQILFSLILLLYIINHFLTVKKISFFDFVIVLIFLYFSVLNRTIAQVHFLGLIVVNQISTNKEYPGYLVNNYWIIGMSLLFTIIYTLLYFGEGSRYMFTGVREVNQGSFAIFLLAVLIRARSRKIGNTVLIFGLLTFSRNYMLAFGLLVIIEYFMNKSDYITKIFHYFFKPKRLVALSLIFLVLLSGVFQSKWKNNEITDYSSGLNRFSSIFDYSNFLRFTTNTNLFGVYLEHPNKLLTGISNEEFFDLSREYSLSKGHPYREIKPHNYFFSYFQLYGILSLPIMLYTFMVIGKILSKRNLALFLGIFVYVIFLGIGVSSYWLFLTVFTLQIEGGLYENRRCNNNY